MNSGSGTLPTTVISANAPAIYQAENSTLVNSPIAGACAACHDTGAARDHMRANGGALNDLRGKFVNNVAGVNVQPLNNTESCLTCHGSGKEQDINTVHMNWQ